MHYSLLDYPHDRHQILTACSGFVYQPVDDSPFWYSRVAMATADIQIALIKGDGIGVDVSEAALALVDAALSKTGEQELVKNR
jgi:hypothetical protein